MSQNIENIIKYAPEYLHILPLRLHDPIPYGTPLTELQKLYISYLNSPKHDTSKSTHHPLSIYEETYHKEILNGEFNLLRIIEAIKLFYKPSDESQILLSKENYDAILGIMHDSDYFITAFLPSYLDALNRLILNKVKPSEVNEIILLMIQDFAQNYTIVEKEKYYFYKELKAIKIDYDKKERKGIWIELSTKEEKLQLNYRFFMEIYNAIRTTPRITKTLPLDLSSELTSPHLYEFIDNLKLKKAKYNNRESPTKVELEIADKEKIIETSHQKLELIKPERVDSAISPLMQLYFIGISLKNEKLQLPQGITLPFVKRYLEYYLYNLFYNYQDRVITFEELFAKGINETEKVRKSFLEMLLKNKS